ncbi:MAG: GAF domain-containing sensor histidine kinase [Chloroflexi bacterium]|nr:GAF domain-containing sensor histidine kinase [Chloroflexota bacterium]
MKHASRGVIQIDWLLFGLRWPLLIATAAETYFLAQGDPTTQLPRLAVLAAGVLYNVALAVFLLARAWPKAAPGLTLFTDTMLAIGLFAAPGPSTLTSSYWAAAFVVVTASLRFSWVWALLVALVIAAADAALLIAFDTTDYQSSLISLIPNAIFLLTGALVAGLVGERTRTLAVKRAHAERDIEERRLKHIREQARAIYKMALLVSETLNYERVLDAALDLSISSMADTGAAASQMVCAALLFHDDELKVITARRFTQADHKVTLPAQSGLVAEVLASGESGYSSDPARDPELSRFIALRGCRTLMAAPLQAGMDNYGVMIFAHPRPDFFDLDHIELLEAICKHTIIAVKNGRLYQKLLEEKERIVEVEEEARKKLARDLHDGPTQSVAALAMRANYIRRLLEREPQSAAEELYKVEELARRTTKEIRHMLFTLRPLVLESQGLAAALQSLADKMRENYDLNVIIEAQPGAGEKLEIHAQGVLFYIAEEAVGNARKHAAAKHIWVRIGLRSPEMFYLVIEDDGVGFNVGAVGANYDQRGSLGMVNMRERTELVSGQLHIDSAEGKGAKITILVPLTEEAREKLMS